MADSFYITDSPTTLNGDVIFQYDDSFEGLMTALFESYSCKPAPVALVGQQHQQLLGISYRAIETDEAKAERVIAGIRRKMGGDAYERVWQGFLSCNPDKGDIIYHYLRLGMQLGQGIRLRLTDERVMAMDKLASLVGKESSMLIQFVRFSRMEGSIYYAKITPDNNVVTLLMPFFTERFNIQPFIIHDETRQIAGVYDTQDWYIVSTEDMQIPRYAPDEIQYRRLWKRFYDTVAIKERVNPTLRRQHMPKRYWRNMTEMAMIDTAAATALPSDISRAAAQALAQSPSGAGLRVFGQPEAQAEDSDVKSYEHGLTEQ